MQMNDLTLLYVEDDQDTQEQMRMLLEDNVKEYHQAFNGEEGLSLYMDIKPDIILSDIHMPTLDGLSMIQKIKEVDKNQQIIIVSALDNREHLLKAINIGVNFFVPKPVDMDTLYKHIDVLTQTIKKENQLKNKVEELHNLAHYDALCNILNRRLFDIKLDQAISKAKEENSSFKLLFIDLDNFKNINDTYGHSAGDMVLKSVAKNIKKLIKKEDIFARIGGDEFSLIIETSSNEEYIDYLIKRITDKFSYSILFKNQTINISCSIGLSSFPQDTDSRKELLHLADLSMYRAKNVKKNEKDRNIIIIDAHSYWNKSTEKFFYENKELALTYKEKKLLSLLFKNLNIENSYEMIVDELWEKEGNRNRLNNIKTIIKQLRRKLPVDLIENIFACGYKIVIKR